MSSAEQAGGPLTRPDVVAAGCVVLRKGADGHEVLLVHRPRYDDWSFPKGKVDRGEAITTCAVREVEEETGHQVELGLPLGEQRYLLANGRPKVVHYWIARVAPLNRGSFVPNDEVDEIRWVSWEDAEALLSYDYDRDTLAQARAQRRSTGVILVVGPAESVPRKEWMRANPGLDPVLRPLTALGHEQGVRAGAELSAFPKGLLVFAPGEAGYQTVFMSPEDQWGWDPEHMAKETALDRRYSTPHALSFLLGRVVQGHPVAALVARRRIAAQILDFFGVRERAAVPGPGEWVAIHHRAGEVLAVETAVVPRPALLAQG